MERTRTPINATVVAPQGFDAPFRVPINITVIPHRYGRNGELIPQQIQITGPDNNPLGSQISITREQLIDARELLAPVPPREDRPLLPPVDPSNDAPGAIGENVLSSLAEFNRQGAQAEEAGSGYSGDEEDDGGRITWSDDGSSSLRLGNIRPEIVSDQMSSPDSGRRGPISLEERPPTTSGRRRPPVDPNGRPPTSEHRRPPSGRPPTSSGLPGVHEEEEETRAMSRAYADVLTLEDRPPTQQGNRRIVDTPDTQAISETLHRRLERGGGIGSTMIAEHRRRELGVLDRVVPPVGEEDFRYPKGPLNRLYPLPPSHPIDMRRTAPDPDTHASQHFGTVYRGANEFLNQTMPIIDGNTATLFPSVRLMPPLPEHEETESRPSTGPPQVEGVPTSDFDDEFNWEDEGVRRDDRERSGRERLERYEQHERRELEMEEREARRREERAEREARDERSAVDGIIENGRRGGAEEPEGREERIWREERERRMGRGGREIMDNDEIPDTLNRRVPRNEDDYPATMHNMGRNRIPRGFSEVGETAPGELALERERTEPKIGLRQPGPGAMEEPVLLVDVNAATPPMAVPRIPNMTDLEGLVMPQLTPVQGPHTAAGFPPLRLTAPPLLDWAGLPILDMPEMPTIPPLTGGPTGTGMASNATFTIGQQPQQTSPVHTPPQQPQQTSPMHTPPPQHAQQQAQPQHVEVRTDPTTVNEPAGVAVNNDVPTNPAATNEPGTINMVGFRNTPYGHQTWDDGGDRRSSEDETDGTEEDTPSGFVNPAGHGAPGTINRPNEVRSEVWRNPEYNSRPNPPFTRSVGRRIPPALVGEIIQPPPYMENDPRGRIPQPGDSRYNSAAPPSRSNTVMSQPSMQWAHEEHYNGHHPPEHPDHQRPQPMYNPRDFGDPPYNSPVTSPGPRSPLGEAAASMAAAAVAAAAVATPIAGQPTPGPSDYAGGPGPAGPQQVAQPGTITGLPEPGRRAPSAPMLSPPANLVDPGSYRGELRGPPGPRWASGIEVPSRDRPLPGFAPWPNPNAQPAQGIGALPMQGPAIPGPGDARAPQQERPGTQPGPGALTLPVPPTTPPGTPPQTSRIEIPIPQRGSHVLVPTAETATYEELNRGARFPTPVEVNLPTFLWYVDWCKMGRPYLYPPEHSYNEQSVSASQIEFVNRNLLPRINPL